MSLMERPGHQTARLSPGPGRLTLGAVGSGEPLPPGLLGASKGSQDRRGTEGEGCTWGVPMAPRPGDLAGDCSSHLGVGGSTVSSPRPGPTRSSPAAVTAAPLPPEPVSRLTPRRALLCPGGAGLTLEGSGGVGGPHSPPQLPKSGVTMQLMVHPQTRGSVLSVPGLGAGASTPTGLWALLRAGLTPMFFRQCLMPTPSPRADYRPKGFRFPRLGPGGCELGREAPPVWAVRRCPEWGLGAFGGGAAQPGLTDHPPGVGLGAGDRGAVALVWGGRVPGLGHRTRPCWRLAEAAAGRRSPRCFSRRHQAVIGLLRAAGACLSPQELEDSGTELCR